MNILIINGSPRKKGLISQMLGIMREEAEKRGDTVEVVYINDLTRDSNLVIYKRTEYEQRQ
jgi:multimeric flavodoxin WrbA